MLFEKFIKKGFTVKPLEHHISHNQKKTELKKTLNIYDAIFFGIGFTIGAGIFVTSGEIAKVYTGPAVTLAYFIAFLATLFSSLCYCEFVVDLPFAGSSYSYIGLMFGEFLAWIGISNLLLEYCLGAATVAKGFTSYIASLFSINESYFKIQVNDWLFLDFPAFLLILAICIIIATSTVNYSKINIAITVITLVTVFVIICAGIPFIHIENYKPYIPDYTEDGKYGIQGIFTGACIAFFSYIGFDFLAVSAEDIKDSEKVVPFAIIFSISFCTIVYLLMATILAGMQKYYLLDIGAPFSTIFVDKGLIWLSKIVSVGAISGLMTSTASFCMGASRLFMVIGREGFIPKWTSIVNDKTNTPINSAIVTFILTSIPTLLFDITTLASLVSMGSLFVFFLVCCAVIWRRYAKENKREKTKLSIALWVIIISSFIEGISYELGLPIFVTGFFIGLWLLSTIICMFLKVEFVSEKFKLPLQPLIPSLGILTNIHLICSLGTNAYIRFGCWQFIAIVVYYFYGMHNTHMDSESSEPLLT